MGAQIMDPRKTIRVAALVATADAIDALEARLSLKPETAAKLREMAEGKGDLELDDAEVNASDAYEALDEADLLEPTVDADCFDQSDVQSLAAAIQRGDLAEARHFLDRVFVTDVTVTEWIQRGRYSGEARRSLRLAS